MASAAVTAVMLVRFRETYRAPFAGGEVSGAPGAASCASSTSHGKARRRRQQRGSTLRGCGAGREACREAWRGAGGRRSRRAHLFDGKCGHTPGTARFSELMYL